MRASSVLLVLFLTPNLGSASLAHAQFTAPAFITAWGTSGTGAGQLLSPVGEALDPAGDGFVVDSNADRLLKFTRMGGFLGQWSTFGGPTGRFRQPSGVAVDLTRFR